MLSNERKNTLRCMQIHLQQAAGAKKMLTYLTEKFTEMLAIIWF